MESRSDISSNTESKSSEVTVDFNDADYDFLEGILTGKVVETTSSSTAMLNEQGARERALKSFLSAKSLLEGKAFALAITPIQDAIKIYKHIENKTPEDWQALSACYELDREIYQNQNQVLLKTNKQVLNVLAESKQATQKVNEELAELEYKYITFESTIAIALKKLQEDNQQYEQQNQNLNYQIQVLQNRPNPTIMEHIANEIRNTFQALRQCNLHYQLASSIYSFFTNLRRCSQVNEPDSPSLQRLKNV